MKPGQGILKAEVSEQLLHHSYLFDRNSKFK